MTLFEAVDAGDAQALQVALKDARDVNVLGPEKRTPLIVAAERGQLALVELLLAAGAEPEWRDATDETAMLKAAANGHFAVAKRLAATASEEDRALGTSFLQAFGAAHAPEYQYDGDGLKRKAVEVAARAANFVGHADPLARVERVERSEQEQRPKKW